MARYQVRFKSFFSRTFNLIIVTSFILIVAFAIIVGISLKSTYEDQQIAANLTDLANSGTLIDSALRNIKESAFVMSINDDIINAAVVPSVLKHNRNYIIIEHLRSIEKADNYIKSAYIYIHTDELVFSTSGYIQPLEIFNDRSSVEHFANSLGVDRKFHQFTENAEQNRIFYCLDFVGRDNFRLGQIILEVDVERLFQNISGQGRGNSADVFVVDDDGKIILGNEGIGEPFVDIADMDILKTRKSGSINQRDNLKQTNLLFISLEIQDWYLVRKIESLRYFMLENEFLKIFIPTFVVYLFLSAILAYLISKSLHKPVRQLVQMVAKERGCELPIALRAKFNEFELIKSEFNSVLDDQKSVEKILYDTIPYITQYLIDRKIHGKPLSEQEKILFSKMINLEQMEINQYFAIALRIINREDAQTIGPSIESSLCLLEIKDMLSEVLGDCIQDIFINSDGNRYNIVVCILPDALRNEMDHLTLKITDHINRMDTEQQETSLIAGVGRMYQGIDQIEKSFLEADQIFNYMLYMGLVGCRSYQDTIISIGNKMDVSVSAMGIDNNIQKVINALSTGEHAKVEQHLKELYKHITNLDYKESKSVNRLFIQILDALIQYSICSDIYITEMANDNTRSIYHKLEQLSTFDEMVNYITDIACKISDQVIKEKSKRYHKYVVKTQEYIKEHYTDHNISLNVIADYVGVNSTYLSKLFNDETNENITEFINKLRIQKARELLDHTDVSVKEVGFCVGFSSIQNFIKTFKRYMGVTPGKFSNRI